MNLALKRIVLIISGLALTYGASGQLQKGAFYGYFSTGLNFCQIDGDAASGYNKFGYTFGYYVGQGLGKKWAYETGVGYSVRGARRAFDENQPALQSFHYVYHMIDIPVYLIRYFGKFSAGGGIRTTYLIRATDKDGFTPNLNSNMSKFNMLGVAHLSYLLTPRWRVFAEYQYSINSIRNNEPSSNLLFPTGVYHNVISMGMRLNMNNEKKE